jgi:hypothetical protein
MGERRKHDDEIFDLLAQSSEEPESVRAPSKLKARVYSALIRRQQSSGPLQRLPETRKAGRGLCVFENFWQFLPLGEKAKCFNCCSLCHARVLAEHLEQPPIYWGNCPYVALKK